MDERIFTVEEFQAEDPIDIARNYAKFKGIDFDDDFVELFKEAAQSVSNDERQ
jgi:hypothetical protein